MLKSMIHRTLEYIFEHKTTRNIIEQGIIAFLENPKTRKQFESMLEQAILEYAKNTGYGGV
jgi:hypothetical protein